MKVIKPLRLGILTRVFEHGREPFFVPTVFACFPFDEPRALFTEQAMWKTLTEELGQGGALDVGLPKVRGEVLLDAHAYAPGGAAQVGVSVEVKIAAIQKKLLVVGDRRWELLGMTMPEPFVTMPIDWAHAFGGEGFAQNPLGKGMGPIVGPDGKKLHPLPNVEYPDQRIQRQGDRPKPASFRAMDYTWPQRMKKLGTYDGAWLEKEFPGFARDIDLEAFNAAAEDQRIAGYFAGDEAFTLTNMHPTEAKLEGRLPGLKARVFATFVEGSKEELREIPMKIDTVHLFPHKKLGVAMFRGMARIREDDAADVKHLLVAAERMGEPRSHEHYAQVLADRLDKQRGGLLALRDKDLLPDIVRYEGDDPFLDDLSAKLARDNLMEENLHRAAMKQYAERVEKVRALGFDPAELVGPPPDPPAKPSIDPAELASVVAAEEKRAAAEEQEMEQSRQDAEAQVRELCAKNGMDYDQIMKKQEGEGGGPPKFSADAEIERIRAAVAEARAAGLAVPGLEAMASDARFEARLRENERALFDMYHRFAHHMPAVADMDGALARTRGEVFLQALEEKTAVAERDFSGADLHGADLQGKDLRRALLEKANLEGVNLEGANLEGVVLTRARLAGANLRGARLSSANLALADLSGATLEGTDLDQAALDGAKLDRTVMRGAKLKGATMDEAVITEADFSGARLEKCIVRSVRADGVTFSNAQLDSTVFLQCDMKNARFDGAAMKVTAFFETKLPGLELRGAKADNVRFVHESAAPGGRFVGASLKGANLRGMDLTGADFEGADLEGADFSEANLEGAKLDRCNLREARFVRANLAGATLSAANLLGSIMQKARVGGASFRGANLFRADLAYVVGDDETTFKGAYLDQVRVIRRQA